MSADERQWYQKFHQCANGGAERITGPEAVTFLRKAGLPNDDLKRVWNLSAKTAKDFLTKEEFYISLRLIAYLQNNMSANLDYVVTNVEVALPYFEGVSPADPWRINGEDLANYDRVWQHFDKDRSGHLSDEDMQQVMSLTKADKETCAKAWELSNPDGDDIFTKPMFLVAMHVINKKKKDPSIQIPRRIPPSLQTSSGMKTNTGEKAAHFADGQVVSTPNTTIAVLKQNYAIALQTTDLLKAQNLDLVAQANECD